MSKTMRCFMLVFATAALSLVGPTQRPPPHIRYYVQMIRAADSTQPPEPGSHLVGANLAAIFKGPLRWKHYWEIRRCEVDVPPGAAVNLPLANQRAVEIDLTCLGKRIIAAFQNGTLLERTVVPSGEALSLIGGNRKDNTAWFIAVRRDKPPY